VTKREKCFFPSRRGVFQNTPRRRRDEQSTNPAGIEKETRKQRPGKKMPSVKSDQRKNHWEGKEGMAQLWGWLKRVREKKRTLISASLGVTLKRGKEPCGGENRYLTPSAYLL